MGIGAPRAVSWHVRLEIPNAPAPLLEPGAPAVQWAEIEDAADRLLAFAASLDEPRARALFKRLGRQGEAGKPPQPHAPSRELLRIYDWRLQRGAETDRKEIIRSIAERGQREFPGYYIPRARGAAGLRRHLGRLLREREAFLDAKRAEAAERVRRAEAAYSAAMWGPIGKPPATILTGGAPQQGQKSNPI